MVVYIISRSVYRSTLTVMYIISCSVYRSTLTVQL